jgi:hypothetical protein
VFSREGDLDGRAGIAVYDTVTGVTTDEATKSGLSRIVTPLNQTTGDVFAYHVGTNYLFQITSSQAVDESLNDVSALSPTDDRIVFNRGDAPNRDVYGVTISIPAGGTATRRLTCIPTSGRPSGAWRARAVNSQSSSLTGQSTTPTSGSSSGITDGRDDSCAQRQEQ